MQYPALEALKLAALASPLPGHPLSTVFRATPHADAFHNTLTPGYAHVSPYPHVAMKGYGTRTGPDEYTTNLHELAVRPGRHIGVFKDGNATPGFQTEGHAFEDLHRYSSPELHHRAHEGLVTPEDIEPSAVHRVRYNAAGEVLQHEPLRPDHPPIVPWVGKEARYPALKFAAQRVTLRHVDNPKMIYTGYLVQSNKPGYHALRSDGVTMHLDAEKFVDALAPRPAAKAPPQKSAGTMTSLLPAFLRPKPRSPWVVPGDPSPLRTLADIERGRKLEAVRKVNPALASEFNEASTDVGRGHTEKELEWQGFVKRAGLFGNLYGMGRAALRSPEAAGTITNAIGQATNAPELINHIGNPLKYITAARDMYQYARRQKAFPVPGSRNPVPLLAAQGAPAYKSRPAQSRLGAVGTVASGLLAGL